MSKSDLFLFVRQQMKLMTVCVGVRVYVCLSWEGVCVWGVASMYVVENWDTMSSNLSH